MVALMIFYSGVVFSLFLLSIMVLLHTNYLFGMGKNLLMH